MNIPGGTFLRVTTTFMVHSFKGERIHAIDANEKLMCMKEVKSEWKSHSASAHIFFSFKQGIFFALDDHWISIKMIPIKCAQ